MHFTSSTLRILQKSLLPVCTTADCHNGAHKRFEQHMMGNLGVSSRVLCQYFTKYFYLAILHYAFAEILSYFFDKLR
jgi:hypothetical protein